jgi:hypothetical protein
LRRRVLTFLLIIFAGAETGCRFSTTGLEPGSVDAAAAAPDAKLGGPDSGGALADAPVTPAADAKLLPDAALHPDAPVVPADALAPDSPVLGADAPISPDAMQEPDAPLPPDAMQPPDAPLPPDAMEPLDAMEPPDAMLPPDAMQPDASLVGVQCGNTVCTGDTPVCCVKTSGPGSTTESCTTASGCAQSADAYHCDGPEDCGGAACCSQHGSDCTVFIVTQCSGDQLCHTADDCPSGQSCCQQDPYPICCN